MAYNPKFNHKYHDHKNYHKSSNVQKDYEKFHYKPAPPKTPTRALKQDEDTIVQKALADNEYQNNNLTYKEYKQVKNVQLYRFAKDYARNHMINGDYKGALKTSIQDLSANVGLDPKALSQKAITKADYFQLKAQRLSEPKRFELFHQENHRRQAVSKYFDSMYQVHKRPTSSGIHYIIKDADMNFRANWLAGGAQIARRKQNQHDYKKHVTDFLRRMHPDAPAKTIAFKYHELYKQRHDPKSRINKVMNLTNNHDMVNALQTIQKQNQQQAKQHQLHQDALAQVKSIYGFTNDHLAEDKLSKIEQNKAKTRQETIQKIQQAKQQEKQEAELKKSLNFDNIQDYAMKYDDQAFINMKKAKPDAKTLKYGKQAYVDIHTLNKDPKQMPSFKIQNAQAYSSWIDKQMATHAKIQQNNKHLIKVATDNEHRKQLEHDQQLHDQAKALKTQDQVLYKYTNALYIQSKLTHNLSKMNNKYTQFITNYRLQYQNMPTKKQRRHSLYNRYEGKLHALNVLYHRNGKPELAYQQNLKALRERYHVLYKHPTITDDQQFAQAIHQEYPNEQVGHLINNTGMNQVTREYNRERANVLQVITNQERIQGGNQNGTVKQFKTRENYKKYHHQTSKVNQYLTDTQQKSIRAFSTIQESPTFTAVRNEVRDGVRKIRQKINPYVKRFQFKEPKLLHNGSGTMIEKLRNKLPNHSSISRKSQPERQPSSQEIRQQRNQEPER